MPPRSTGRSLTKKKSIDRYGRLCFPAGCENFGSGRREQSKRTSRRLLRLRRIRYARIRARKFYLLREMAKHNMCPPFHQRNFRIGNNIRNFPRLHCRHGWP